jgi:translation initiation factor 2B subunit (eIF-2B alpha/beta/delta family)/8-oxo-dGTP pyrophosphatase MutT (NUDIX family)
MATDVVTCFLRNRGQVLLNHRADDAPAYPGRWAGISGCVEPGETPEIAARREIDEETGLTDPTLVRSGGVQSVHGDDPDREWAVHPFLFDVRTRAVEDSTEHAEPEWCQPTAILRRDTVPGLWRTYRRVGPTVRTVVADDEHGSAYISVRALEVLRDRAGLIAVEQAGTKDDDWAELADLAVRLRESRPGMAALANRVNRAIATADGRTPAAVETAAIAGIERALSADENAAAAAAERVTGERVLTLSRSGTVLAALREGDPAAVFVAESRPAREGVGVAEQLAGTSLVTLHADGAIADVLARQDVDLVIVGVDTLRPDGGVVNKTGTRTAAVAADHEGVPVYAAAASDKVATGPVSLESAAGTDVYDGHTGLDVYNPLFDETPPELVTGAITERGTLLPEEVAEIAEQLRSLADWDGDGDGDNNGDDDGNGAETGAPR